jgi:hypothetical protein
MVEYTNPNTLSPTSVTVTFNEPEIKKFKWAPPGRGKASLIRLVTIDGEFVDDEKDSTIN